MQRHQRRQQAGNTTVTVPEWVNQNEFHVHLGERVGNLICILKSTWRAHLVFSRGQARHGRWYLSSLRDGEEVSPIQSSPDPQGGVLRCCWNGGSPAMIQVNRTKRVGSTKHIVRLVVLIAALCTASVAYADTLSEWFSSVFGSARPSGQVTDLDTKQPIAGAWVIGTRGECFGLAHCSHECVEVRVAVSDVNGAYTFDTRGNLENYQLSFYQRWLLAGLSQQGIGKVRHRFDQSRLALALCAARSDYAPHLLSGASASGDELFWRASRPAGSLGTH